ncbi:MAG: hypothetical protein AAFY09_10740 [Pseudomonadota bacterium]
MSTLLKNPIFTSFIAGLTLAGTVALVPFEAAGQDQGQNCIAEIRVIDETLKTKSVEAQTLARVNALRESALVLHSQGDTSGCMRDVGDIKALLGL